MYKQFQAPNSTFFNSTGNLFVVLAQEVKIFSLTLIQINECSFGYVAYQLEFPICNYFFNVVVSFHYNFVCYFCRTSRG